MQGEAFINDRTNQLAFLLALYSVSYTMTALHTVDNDTCVILCALCTDTALFITCGKAS